MLTAGLAGIIVGTSSFDFDISNAIDQSFAGAASFLAVASAFIAWIAHEDELSIGQIADAAGLGLAIAFWPAIVVGGYMFIDVWASGLTPT
jgi:hypothetical protein